MYILLPFPIIIPILMFAPVLIALQIDKKKIDHPIASNIIQIAVGFFIGSLIYLGIFYLQYEFLQYEFERDWGLLQTTGVILPILLGLVFLYIKGREQIRLFSFKRGGIGASALFFLFTVIPFLLLSYLAFFNFFDLRIASMVLATLVIPVLFGLWLLLSMSNYTRKYFLAYTLLSLLSSLLYLFLLIGFSFI